MTTTQALTAARKRWGKSAAVKKEPRGGYVGEHGEFVDTLSVRPKDSEYARAGHYYCMICSKTGERVYHRPGSVQASYTVGRVALGMFFEVKGRGDSWARAFAQADMSEKMEREQYAAMRAAQKAVSR